MNLKIWAFLIAGFYMFFCNLAFAIDYDDDIVLEPYLLTKELAHQLTQKDSSQTTAHSLVLNGISLTISNQKENSFSLDVKVDPRLNLWRGNPQSISSEHQGQLEVIISAVTDKNGANIYDDYYDKNPITKEKNYRVFVYHLKDRSFTGPKHVSFNKKSEDLYPTKITGTIKLSLPVNVKKYEVNVDSPETTKALTGRDDIDSVELNNGIHIRHPHPLPEFTATVMGFNKANQLLKVDASGSAGVNKDNHWYNYEQNSGFDRALIFIADEMIDIEIPFSLAIKDVNAK